jgi:hypothetical protein
METAIRDKGGMYRKTPAEGASTQVFAAISPELAEQGGSYLEDCHVSNALAPHARDAEAATQLWSLSEELVGETFPA